MLGPHRHTLAVQFLTQHVPPAQEEDQTPQAWMHHASLGRTLNATIV